MLIARVVGRATATVKHPSLLGWKLLVVQPLMADESKPDGDPLLAIDNLDAGVGETVVLSSDGARLKDLVGPTSPARWSVIGIRD